MKKLVLAVVGLFILSFAGLAHADYVGNRDSKFFFPENCSYVKLIKKDHLIMFKTSREALAAGYKVSSKCKDYDSNAVLFVGNRGSKLYFPANCSYVAQIKEDNRVTFGSTREALAAGYKISSKCSDK